MSFAVRTIKYDFLDKFYVEKFSTKMKALNCERNNSEVNLYWKRHYQMKGPLAKKKKWRDQNKILYKIKGPQAHFSQKNHTNNFNYNDKHFRTTKSLKLFQNKRFFTLKWILDSIKFVLTVKSILLWIFQTIKGSSLRLKVLGLTINIFYLNN